MAVDVSPGQRPLRPVQSLSRQSEQPATGSRRARGSQPMTAYSHPETLAEAEWLAGHLEDSDLHVIEVDVSPKAYNDGHVPGAVLWNVYRDLKDAEYHLVDTAALEQLVVRSGIRPDSTVVFYGYAPALGFWLMKMIGHRDARILNCSRDAWRAEGHPWSTVIPNVAPGRYHIGGQDRRIRAERAAVLDAIDRRGMLILDVRSESEYDGERFWPSGGQEPNGRAGHIPSAVRQPVDGLYDERGAFRDQAALGSIFSSVNPDQTDDLITYCTIGGRAATAWFVLSQLLGRDGVRVYEGSWAEWGRLADTPVATGSEAT
jgi:thiosulfate/3-mercaptopyruvate sulfurtransferase